ncbi:dye decolorizing peroxidase [Actinacidiphila yanglinensis]|uniref:Dye decolorizing peroxidase n=1 Tax=Actinacidiphila yanglinensis TaxID=310779 RepID=A0A1H5Z1J4_9ACTN|nr:Dyp-type peroxidase [Actinacidiphila yanglinensis]SEG29475.1 dye decolorizing peroxidase [Actinacidiphila yanglinensis]
MRPADHHPSRRRFLDATGALAAIGLTAGCTADSARSDPHQPSPAATPAPVPPTGRYQAGITLPQPAQPHLLAVVADLAAHAAAGPLLAELGQAVSALTAGTDARLLGMPPGDLTVTIGVGPRLVRTAGPSLPGAADLPRFSRERIDAQARGGDLLLQICASDALLPAVVATALLDRAGDRLRERWRQSGQRGANIPVDKSRTAPRNLLGFIDGIVGPHTTAAQERNLWLAGPAPVAGGTLAVVRRMELDLPRFAALSVAEQEAVFGRRRESGNPLSGGAITADPSLGAKTPDGRYLIPADAHVRRANATVVGAGLMLRRSYSTDQPTAGLLFISFQNDMRTFTDTLTHMDDSDALLGFTTATAGGTFLILPGFDARRPLGSTLFR